MLNRTRYVIFPAVLLFLLATDGGSAVRLRDEYDYIIVGAGSTGATVASRLAEDNWATVLLLEAGGEPLPVTEIPYLTPTLKNTIQDWSYLTEPQKHACFGMKEQRSSWPRGKALGGTSTLNYMMYTRGNKKDYDNWAKKGCYGWSYKDVLPYFMKSENNKIPGIANNGFHGTEGSLTVSTPSHATPIRDAFVEGGKELGYQEVDYNGAQQTGFSNIHATIRDGTRCSTEKAFLRQPRENMHIVTHAFVTKVQFDSKKTATSVVFEHENFTHTIQAHKEIIISAGAINSPQLLMLSGVGPKEHLEELGIAVVSDLPGVGANLQDHVGSGLSYRFSQPVALPAARIATDEKIEQFAKEQSGPLTIPGGLEGAAFVNTQYADPSEDFPDIQIILVSTSFGLANSKEEILAQYVDIDKTDSITMIPYLLRPESSGYIKLRSQDPHDHPIIDPRYFTKGKDLDILKEGLRITKELGNTKPFRKLGAQLFPDVVPGCEKVSLWSDDYYTCLVQTLSYTIYHPAGTCKMGEISDPTTVVDPELRVKGVKGLRVADASIMPDVISGNTNAPCIMIGEKLADLIKNEKESS